MNILEQNDPAHFLKGCCWKEHCKCSMHLGFGGRNGSAESKESQLLTTTGQNHHPTVPLGRGHTALVRYSGKTKDNHLHLTPTFNVFGSPILITPLPCKEPAASKQPETKSKYVFKQLAQQELDNPYGDSRWLRDLLFALPACNVRNQGKSQRAVTLGGSTHWAVS